MVRMPCPSPPVQEYNNDTAPQFAREIADEVKRVLAGEGWPRYKLVVQCVIGEQGGQVWDRAMGIVLCCPGRRVSSSTTRFRRPLAGHAHGVPVFLGHQVRRVCRGDVQQREHVCRHCRLWHLLLLRVPAAAFKQSGAGQCCRHDRCAGKGTGTNVNRRCCPAHYDGVGCRHGPRALHIASANDAANDVDKKGNDGNLSRNLQTRCTGHWATAEAQGPQLDINRPGLVAKDHPTQWGRPL